MGNPPVKIETGLVRGLWLFSIRREEQNNLGGPENVAQSIFQLNINYSLQQDMCQDIEAHTDLFLWFYIGGCMIEPDYFGL